MKSILYIGNKLKKHNKNASGIEVLGALLEKASYTVYYASSKKNKLLRVLDMLWACFAYRHIANYVIIDTYSTQNFYFAYAVSQCCRLLQLKYIPILHGGNLAKRLKRNPKLSQSIFLKAYISIAPSEYMMEQFKSYGYHNIVSIPNTIEIKHYKFEARPFKSINLLWVRSFSKIYNPQLAVEVLKALTDEGIKASLCMVGPDNDGSLKTLKNLADKYNLDVRFTGKLSKEAWITLSKEYNVFINTTNFDNMPVSVIEAMALGLPVVSTNVGGIPYLIEHNKEGILVPPHNPQAFVSAIKTIIDDDMLRNNIINNARKKVEQFDWDHVKTLWHNVLN
ncbi:glycosyltransferase family 4 protein [Seonamhaeicola aphaedonensis]|uniref:glycosyltransferase family 4 protein n=1 Tax=Seonamhaeicola aphaedonensis TaxID=1461338 RepID=UPI000E30A245|nr:glycosyltransferase family 4 protein [Seonamhaeicola aphaedonensis]